MYLNIDILKLRHTFAIFVSAVNMALYLYNIFYTLLMLNGRTLSSFAIRIEQEHHICDLRIVWHPVGCYCYNRNTPLIFML